MILIRPSSRTEAEKTPLIPTKTKEKPTGILLSRAFVPELRGSDPTGSMHTGKSESQFDQSYLHNRKSRKFPHVTTVTPGSSSGFYMPLCLHGNVKAV
ncbi:hypothetical protein GBF38_006427 [Nibea albiflora]|uniref:Uncharacterized protein n=1 Tax=Nibea albiflora TaxID=240163 RepID=A0ACB7FBA7_NIBAL|nr:hypothetical protein GBF38_006427 [Nibea albiflora]